MIVNSGGSALKVSSWPSFLKLLLITSFGLLVPRIIYAEEIKELNIDRLIDAGFYISVAEKNAENGLRHFSVKVPNSVEGMGISNLNIHLFSDEILQSEIQILCVDSKVSNYSFCEFNSKPEFVSNLKLRLIYSSNRSSEMFSFYINMNDVLN